MPHQQAEDFKSCVFVQTTLLNQGFQESALPPVEVACESPAIQKNPFRVYSFSRNSNPSSAFLFLWQTGLKISGWAGNDSCTFLSIKCSRSWSRSGFLLAATFMPSFISCLLQRNCWNSLSQHKMGSGCPSCPNPAF